MKAKKKKKKKKDERQSRSEGYVNSQPTSARQGEQSMGLRTHEHALQRHAHTCRRI